MRVHIVCDRPEKDRIIPRMARYLRDWNGWTLNKQPDPNASCNVFLPYIPLQQRFPGWEQTPIVAYFSHRDTENAGKRCWYDDAAASVGMRVTVPQRDAAILEHYGPTMIARPPVERDRFVIAPSSGKEKPVVGVSGYPYGDRRKGEHLIEALARSELGKRLILRGSGRDWAVPTRGYSWGSLPSFFQSLDVLVCPSLNEGVPLPPLEALACGIKIVIPRGVGMLDELPKTQGIFRYTCGDVDDFVSTVEEAAFSPPVDRQALRELTAEMTPENWARDYARAVEALICSVPFEATPLGWREHSGVYIVAFGEPARECARRWIPAISEQMPMLGICLVSTEPLGPEDIFIEQPETDIGGRTAKLRMYELSPADWDYVLYLDADIELVGDVSAIFRWLQDGWELAICRDMTRYALVENARRPDNLDECAEMWGILGTRQALQYNGGMMGFRRCERVARFFEVWQEEWQKYGKRDQLAFMRARERVKPRIWPLHNQWNASDRYPLPPGEIAALHHNTQARRWTGIINGRADSDEAWKAVERWEAVQA